MIKYTIKAIITAGLVAACAFRAMAQGEASPPAKPDSKSKPVLTAEEKAAAERNYMVPSPSDILSAVGPSGRLDWAAVSAQITKSGAAAKNSYGENSLKALNFGVQVADAFVAVLAKDKKQFQQSRNAVTKLATELSASTSLNEKSEKAKTFVDDGKWPELNNLLEEIRGETLDELEKKETQDGFILASLGGWLRGLDLVTRALAENYDAESTKVLRQPGLIAFFEERVDKLGDRAARQTEVQLIKSKMPDIKALCTFDKEATVPQEKVKKLNEITTELIAAVRG